MDFIALDTETGGFYPAVNALLSIGACCSWSGETFHEYVAVGGQWQAGGSAAKWVHEDAAKVNGYSWDEWERRGAVPLITAMHNLNFWLQARKAERPHAKFVCHNLEFDRSHLREAERMTQVELPHRHDWRCSQLKFGEMMDKGHLVRGSSGLDRLGELSGLWPVGERPAVHGALADAQACLHGYQWLLKVEATAGDAVKQLYTDSLNQRRRLEQMICEVADFMDSKSSWEEAGAVASMVTREAKSIRAEAESSDEGRGA